MDRTFSSHLSIFPQQKPGTVTLLLCVPCVTKAQLWDSIPRLCDCVWLEAELGVLSVPARLVRPCAQATVCPGPS